MSSVPQIQKKKLTIKKKKLIQIIRKMTITQTLLKIKNSPMMNIKMKQFIIKSNVMDVVLVQSQEQDINAVFVRTLIIAQIVKKKHNTIMPF